MSNKRYPTPKKFTPVNVNKYKGDYNNIVARSSWEYKFFCWCDLNNNIIMWSSEEIIIPYLSPEDNEIHRYFPDALITMKNRSGKLVTILIEIKPYSQTIQPVLPKRQTPKFIKDTLLYMKNSAKWEAANNFAKQRGWDFKIITEYELGLKKR